MSNRYSQISGASLDAPADCTIACDKGHLTAHKLILCDHSKYLHDILSKYPTAEHPIIILTELNIVDIKILVNYMYTGELVITNDSSPSSLLRAAQILKIDSLTADDNNHSNNNNNNNSNNNNNNHHHHQDHLDDEQTNEHAVGLTVGELDEDEERDDDDDGRERDEDAEDDLMMDEDDDDDYIDNIAYSNSINNNNAQSRLLINSIKNIYSLNQFIDTTSSPPPPQPLPRQQSHLEQHLQKHLSQHQHQNHHQLSQTLSSAGSSLPSSNNTVISSSISCGGRGEGGGGVGGGGNAGAGNNNNNNSGSNQRQQQSFVKLEFNSNPEHSNNHIGNFSNNNTPNSLNQHLQQQLSSHLDLHDLQESKHLDNKNNKIRCHLCNIGLSDVKCLYRHVLTRHLPEKWGYKCEFCDREFSRDDHLMRHYTTKHKNMEFNREKIRETRRLNREMAKNFHDQISTA